MKINKSLLLISLTLLTACATNTQKSILDSDFMVPGNIYGTWKIVGFQDAWYITGKKDTNYVNEYIGTEVVLGDKSYKITTEKKDFNHKLNHSYNVCDSNNTSGECSSATLRSMAIGGVEKIISFETCDPERKTPYTECFPAYGVSMYIFKDRTKKVMFPSDGGYFVIEKD